MRAMHSLAVVLVMAAHTTVFSAPAPFEVRVPNFQTYGFEDGVPAEFSVGGGSKLATSDAVFKAERHSLRWEWTQAGAALTYRHEEAFKHLTGEDPDPIVYEWVTFCQLSTLSFWVYSETPIEDVLWFEIGDGKTVDCRFWMKLNFKGWRRFQAMYGRDIPGFPNQKTANTLRIIAPKNVAKGALHLDQFCPRSEQDVRFVRGGDHAPWVRDPEAGEASGDPGKYAKGRSLPGQAEKPALLEIEVPDQLSPDQLEAMHRLTESYLARYLGNPIKPRPLSTRELAYADQLRGQLAIVRHGDTVSGKVGRPMSFWGGVSRAASLWHLAADQPEARTKLSELLIDCADLWIQHGRGAGYAMRDRFGRPLALMRDALKPLGKLRPLVDSLRRVNGVQGFDNPEAGANADVYNTVLRARLFLIFVGDDPVQKYRDLKALQHWLERTARYGEIRPDGSFFHHGQTYSGYNFPAIGPLVDVNYLLHGTEFAAPTSHLMARRIAYAMHMYTNVTEAPHTLGGRWRGTGGFGRGHARMYRKLAEMGNPETGAPFDEAQGRAFDREMAEIYLYYASHFGTSDLVKAPKGQLDESVVKFCEMGLKPHNTDGHLSLNYTVAAVHRRDNWMVFFRGQRRQFMAAESYGFQAGNTMGRYLNYGHLAIISGGSPPNCQDSGWPRGKVDFGWDFNFWPGTTAREIPLDALRTHFMVEEFTTAETFAAGTSLDGNGVFGMKLQEDLSGEVDPLRIGPPKYWLGEKEYQRLIKESCYDTTFRARKSVFCFDNRVLCLGSGITSEDAEHRVCTTLFQHSLLGRLERHVPFPQEERLTFEAA